MSNTVHVLKREGKVGHNHWRQFEIIRDDSVVILNMQTAVLGWNVRDIIRQGHDDWCGWKADSILEHKNASYSLHGDNYVVFNPGSPEEQEILALEAKYAGVTGYVKRD